MQFNRFRFPDGEVMIVVAFDICSSSDIIEGLTQRNDIGRYKKLIERVKHRLAELQVKIAFEPYKFTGDGWILLFQASTTRGSDLLDFMRNLSAFFKGEIKKLCQYLDAPPTITGINFGVDKGPIFHTKIFQIDEYIGRPINVACRLQAAIKDSDRSPAYKVLASNFAYFGHLSQPKKRQLRVQTVGRKLRNIHGGRKIMCMKIQLMP